MGLFRRSDEGLYQGDPQLIHLPTSGSASAQRGGQVRPAPPLFDDPPRAVSGAKPTARPPAPPGTFAAPLPPEPEGADPDAGGQDGVPTRAPATTRRSTARATGTQATAPATTGRSELPTTDGTVTGRLGHAAVILHAGNRYRVTVSDPRRRAGPIWDRSKRPQHGFSILDLSITRIDRADDVRQISWSDWTLRVGPRTVEGELGGGGWVDTATTTVRLDPGRTATGTLVFDVPAGAGVLSLGASGAPASARWSILAVKTVVAPIPAAVGSTVRSDAGGVPLTA